MVIMDSYYTSQNRLQEIWNSIDKLHLSYLEMEESTEKLEHRMKLEEYIREFLSIASHNQKFLLPETTEVLQRSASCKKDFSGYKAATGWNAIQLYAGNLLAQPWRKEYRQIKTYCGFYKHQIEANLVGAEIMFEAMGYKHDGDGVLVLDGPICPDRVETVSKDCLVAYVECQILKLIWEAVSPSKITWQDVLEFRNSHMCSPEQTIKALKYSQQQRQYHQEHTRSYSQGSDYAYNLQRTQNLPTLPNTGLYPINNSFPPLTSHHHNIQITPQCPYANNCCTNNYVTYAPVPPPPPPAYMYQTPIVKPQFNANGYYYNGYTPPQIQPYPYPVPTAQLIELESQNGYDVVDKAKPRHTLNPEPLNLDLIKKNNNNDSKPPSKESEFEDWDYVYKDLESQGYSKDLGERGDLLSPSSNERRRLSKDLKKVKTTNLDELLLNNLAVSDRPLKMTEAIEKFEKDKKKPIESKAERRSSQGSYYENIHQETTKKQPIIKSNTSNYAKTKTLPKEKVTAKEILPTKTVQSKTLDSRKLKDVKKPAENITDIKTETGKWQCKACTFLNDSSKSICEICSKTRTNSESEQTMEVGGSVCSKCTLVNPKEAKVCQACGASLSDSPTYI